MTELVWVSMVVVAVLVHSWVAERSANARETLPKLRHKEIMRHLRLQTLWLASIQQDAELPSPLSMLAEEAGRRWQ
jgi:hypothetical protein